MREKEREAERDRKRDSVCVENTRNRLYLKGIIIIRKDIISTLITIYVITQI